MNLFLFSCLQKRSMGESKMNGEFGNGKGFWSESCRQTNLKLKFQVSTFYRFFWTLLEVKYKTIKSIMRAWEQVCMCLMWILSKSAKNPINKSHEKLINLAECVQCTQAYTSKLLKVFPTTWSQKMLNQYIYLSIEIFYTN